MKKKTNSQPYGGGQKKNNNNNNRNNNKQKPSNTTTQQQTTTSSSIIQQQQQANATATTTPIVNNNTTTATQQNSTTTASSNVNKQEGKASVLIGDKPLDPYLTELFSVLMSGTKASNEIPSSKEFDFLTSHFPQFRGAMDESANALKLALSSFLGQKNKSNSVMDDPEVMFESTVDLLDQYFENVDMALDEMDMESNADSVGVNPSQSNSGSSDQTLKSMSRPQLKWNDVDNRNMPFVPNLKSKPNAFVASLEKSMKIGSLDDDDEEMSGGTKKMGVTFEHSTLPPFPFRFGVGNGVGGETTRQSSPHPYLPELLSLQFMKSQTTPPEKAISYAPLENSPCTWISTVEDLHKLATILEGQDAFAIDLEQHSYRSFQGFVCLMQISTRSEDFLIDTLELRQHMHILNSSFTHPKIVKVMHGSDCDILWLQRDFAIYCVNLFDTGQACRTLALPGCSLAYLLKHYCGIDADKKYQLADWRVRPLPSEMVKYAREDTHYLLYIYDRLRQDIFNTKPNTSTVSGFERMEEVLVRSKELCMRRYEKELFSETSYLSLIKFSRGCTASISENVIRVLFKWRDTVARKDDESIRYVLPDHMILSIAQEAPTEVSQLLSCCNPVPKLVRRDAKIIVDLITKALQSRDMPEPTFSTPSKIPDESYINQHAKPSFELESPIVNPHYKTPSRMSPVMNTDDLYNIAGWIESKNYYPSSSMSKLTFSEEEDEVLETIENIRKHSNVNVTPSKKSSLFFPPSNSSFNKDKVSQIMSSFSLGNGQTSNKQQNDEDTSMMDSSNILTDDPTLDDAMDTSSSFINTPINNTKNPSARVTPEEERVPLSLNEIYKLSQKNRKKNKQKKKLKQDSVSDPSPAYDGDDNDDEDIVIHQPTIPTPSESIPTQKPVDFMKKIGWLGAEEELSASEEEKEEEVNASVAVKVPNYSKPNMNVRKKPSKNYVQNRQHKY